MSHLIRDEHNFFPLVSVFLSESTQTARVFICIMCATVEEVVKLSNSAMQVQHVVFQWLNSTSKESKIFKTHRKKND